jgi:iron complex outermembrane receptor protein
VLDDVYDTRAGLNTPEQDIEAMAARSASSCELSDNITLKNICAYRKDRSATPIDFDSLPQRDVDVPAIYRNKQFSNEFQLLYEGEGAARASPALYYLDATPTTLRRDPGDHRAGGAARASPPPPSAMSTKTWAAFGDFTFDFTEQLSLSLGGRYTTTSAAPR